MEHVPSDVPEEFSSKLPGLMLLPLKQARTHWLAEFGLVFLQSPDALRRVLNDVLEDASNDLPGVMR
ncbi:hypothetical protein [Kinneretia aquatilis]|nr:hypothetical protein [Paucibacter aquatile]